MILTLITINYNNASGLENTLKSIQNQVQVDDWEHIIIDGGSQDNSEMVINDYALASDHPVTIVSEADKGIYDAMNKGLRLARGINVAFLNSGDSLAKDDTLLSIISVLRRDNDVNLIYGNIVFKDTNEQPKRYWRPGEFRKYKLLLGWHLPHPMTTLKLDRVNVLGGFDEKLRIAADYHLLLKYAWAYKIKYKYLPCVTVNMEPGGISNGSLGNIIKANYEALLAWRDLDISVFPFWILFTKPLIKLGQYKIWKNSN